MQHVNREKKKNASACPSLRAERLLNPLLAVDTSKKHNLVIALMSTEVEPPHPNHSSSLSPLAYPSLPPLKVSLSLGAPLGPDAMGVPTLETAAVERPSAGVVSSKSWS